MDPKTHKYVVFRNNVFGEISSYYDSKNIATVDDDVNATIGTICLPLSTNMEGSSQRGIADHQEHGGQQNEENFEATKADTNQLPKRTITRPACYRDENFVSTYSCYFASPIDDGGPSYFNEAKGEKEWVQAMDEEMNALMKNKT